MNRYHSKSGLNSKQIGKKVSEFGLDSIPLPPPLGDWFRVKYTFTKLLEKVLEYGPKDRLVLIDYYIGLLFLARAWLESGRWPVKDLSKK